MDNKIRRRFHDHINNNNASYEGQKNDFGNSHIFKQVRSQHTYIMEPKVGKMKKLNIFFIFIFIILFIVLTFAVVILFLPDVIHPVAYSFDGERPSLKGVLQPNDILMHVERKGENILYGPESFATSNGRIFTSTKKGVFEISPTIIPKFAARIGHPPCETSYDEFTCGRPLGLTTDHDGLIYVADAYLGIFTINPNNYSDVHIIFDKTQMDTYGLKFLNSIQISNNGIIYFTSSSSKWERIDFMKALLEATPDGKVCMYKPVSNHLTVLVTDLIFPNGLLLNPTEDFLLISETGKARILKYDLTGDTHGHLSVFVPNLPLYPDNIKFSPHGYSFWVTAAALRAQGYFSFLDSYASRPQLKRYLFKFLSPNFLSRFLGKYGLILEIDTETGNISRSLHDPSGKHVYETSEAFQHNNILYIGSFEAPFYSTLNLSQYSNNNR